MSQAFQASANVITTHSAMTAFDFCWWTGEDSNLRSPLFTLLHETTMLPARYDFGAANWNRTSLQRVSANCSATEL